jgi:hypothetical protein
MHDHIRAGSMQPSANRRADPARATGNQRYLVLQ